MSNMPEMKIGLVGVSRDCFPIELTRRRLQNVVTECRKLKLDIVPCSTIVESEGDALIAVAELERESVDAAVLYLGNFGPEGPTTILAKTLNKPFMFVGAAEESKKDLVNGRGDAFCGMLNACLNAGLRNLRAYVPPRPIGLPYEVAANIAHFVDVARVVVGIKHLKTFSFGPRPQDFYACNAPIKPLYDLDIEVMENSELDLLQIYKSAAGRKKEIDAIARDMAKELGPGNKRPDKLKQLAQFELALTGFFEENLGSRRYGLFANKCWPAFESAFGFVPCFVNSRLASRGIPVACETDIYGAVSEYMAQLASFHPVTILDINNTVPNDIKIADLKGAARTDLFMGFHCGNTPSCHLNKGFAIKYQLIMNRLLEPPDKEPDITAGTLEGTFKPSPTTVFRLHSAHDGKLMSYAAEGHILKADPASFGCIGVFGIKDFARFYRYVLLEKQFPHHAAVAFKHAGNILFDAVKLLGIEDIQTPRTAKALYPEENPF
ncbi:MAG: fucose isomerase [Lentisphaerae bacterium]|nr:fucose isomerase [Lentisphaerota bacterium]